NPQGRAAVRIERLGRHEEVINHRRSRSHQFDIAKQTHRKNRVAVSRDTIPVRTENERRKWKTHDIPGSHQRPFTLQVLKETSALGNPWAGDLHHHQILSTVFELRTYVVGKGHVATFVLAQFLPVQPDGREVIDALKNQAKQLPGLSLRHHKLFSVPPLFFVHQGKLLALIVEVHSLKANLELHFARHLDGAKTRIIELWQEDLLPFTSIHGKRAEFPVRPAEQCLRGSGNHNSAAL